MFNRFVILQENMKSMKKMLEKEDLVLVLQTALSMNV